MAQLPHFESDSSTHEGEGMVTATEGEWVRAHPSYTKIRLIQVVGLFITLVGVFTALTVMFEMMRSSDVLPKTTWLSALTGAIAAVLVVWGIWWAALLPRRTRALGYSLRPNHLMARQGVLFRHVTSIPYGRIQYVDVDSGPLERAHHLVRLTIRTAGVTASKVTLYGIPTECGQQLRELLIRRADERMAAL
ncbi:MULTISPECIES: PH domain-containing protein [Rothia]|uniref:PH domain-containing protein n=1 Tax=Rothia TaxID=32207 RepID=UPI001EE885F2|nr:MULTISPECIES: PH domain-containing protein [Rothia]